MLNQRSRRKIGKKQTTDFKYESKNYKTKLAHFVMKVNYSANWQSNLKHCHTSTATRCILLPWPSTFIPEYKMRSGILYLKPLYRGLPLKIYIGTQSINPSLYRAFSSFFYLPFAVALEVAHLGFTYFTIDVIDQSGMLKRGRGGGVRRQYLFGRDYFMFAC